MPVKYKIVQLRVSEVRDVTTLPLLQKFRPEIFILTFTPGSLLPPAVAQESLELELEKMPPERLKSYLPLLVP